VSSPTEHAWLEALAAIDDNVERERMAANSVLPPDAPAHVHLAVLSAIYSDLPRAYRLVDVGKAVAAVRADSPSRAFAAKCDAHVAYIRGDHEAALAAYQEALRLFDESGDDLESARTLSSGLQTLILLGQYDQARRWAARAKKIFLKHGDALRLARLDSNVGNILFRQDRPREGIVHYERALEGFQNLGDGKDVAAVLSNLAVCHTALAHFAEAFSFYRSAREACVGNGLMALAAQADYNIAYLHYLRGDYRAAREIYERCRQDADAYHSALCDLDEAELLLELNLTHEGELLAERAERGFAALGMRYEQAKALVNRAVAASQRGDHELADQNLRKPRRLFVRENNQTWRAMTEARSTKCRAARARR
jgi:tetratricopeptide (TPR) repeat protein